MEKETIMATVEDECPEITSVQTETDNQGIPERDTQCRKYFLTINNPAEHGFQHEVIEKTLIGFKGLKYFCMADEQGSCYHTHIYAVFNSPVRFSTVRKRFNNKAHVEMAHGTSVQCRNYVGKFEKWENDVKHGTKVDGTFFEYGELPVERQGERSDLTRLYEMIKDGLTNYEILEANPDYMSRMTEIEIERARQTIKAEEYRTVFRQLRVTYIFGQTATGKTRYVMEKYGYENVCRITENKSQHPFDKYKMEDVIMFEEFHSGAFKLQDMNNYLDGYPLELPCRYANKQACYTKVYIISNIDIRNIYKKEKTEERAVYNAFMRRIQKVICFSSDGTRKEYRARDYLNGVIGEVIENVDIEDTPFGDMEKGEK